MVLHSAPSEHGMHSISFTRSHELTKILTMNKAETHETRVCASIELALTPLAAFDVFVNELIDALAQSGISLVQTAASPSVSSK